jgi:uncharacterized membrane protein YoaK (UPF0700 family)
MESTHSKESPRIDGTKMRHFFSPRLLNLTPESIGVGVLLAIVGGFLDAYTYVSRGGVFANAQTGNLVLIGVKGIQGQWTQGLLHIPPIISFMIGTALIEVFKHPILFEKSPIPNPARIVLFIEIAILVIVGTLPPGFPNMIVTVMIAFVASIQFSSFRKLANWSYNSAMITGNLRTATDTALLAIFQRDDEAIKKTIHFLAIIISFLFGAVIGTLATMHIGTKSIWIASGILFLALLIVGPNPKTVSQKKEHA